MENKNKIIRYVESFVLLPIMTMSLSLVNLQGDLSKKNEINFDNNSPVVLSLQENIKASKFATLNQVVNDDSAKILKIKADAVDAYFKEREMPLAGLGMQMVVEAEKNDLDWRLLAAIAVRESTGGKDDCDRVEHNFFGWGSCKIGFKSDREAIEIVAKNLGGNNPNTAKFYAGKNTVQILKAYNPPHIVKRYSEQVIAIMDTIGEKEITIE